MSSLSLDADLARQRLGRAWIVWAVLHAGAVAAAAVALGGLAGIQPWPWVGPVAAVALLQLALLRWWLPDNRGPDEQLRSRLGAGTAVSLIRGLLIAGVAGFIASPPEGGLALWLPGALYLAAALADRLDGSLARATDHVTRLGARLDVELDALGLLVAPTYGVIMGRLPPWYLLLGATYYLFKGGLGLRRARGLPVFEGRLRPSAHSRVFAGLQMALVGVALCPILPARLTWLAATLFMIPVLVGFGRDWGIVTGRLDPTSPGYGRAIPRLIAAVRGILPLLVRALLLAIGLWAALHLAEVAPTWLALLVPILLGILPRLASLGLVLLLGFTPLTPVTGIATACALMILLLGGGRWSLWPAEERWLFRR